MKQIKDMKQNKKEREDIQKKERYRITGDVMASRVQLLTGGRDDLACNCVCVCVNE